LDIALFWDRLDVRQVRGVWALSQQPDIESYIKRILPDQVDLPAAGRKALATLITIDGNADTVNSLFPVLEEISKNDPLTASDLEMLGEIADSITAVAVPINGVLPNNQVRVKYAIKAIASTMGRAARAGEESKDNSEVQEVHLGPFTCRESAEKSLEIADGLTCNISPAPLSDIIGKFPRHARGGASSLHGTQRRVRNRISVRHMLGRGSRSKHPASECRRDRKATGKLQTK
jgi:hypothetical protein